MSKSCEPKPVALSGKIYERLLALYPMEHRREYGPPMAQLFRDQCRDAWTEARGWGLALLWLRTSIDLVKTSTLEHLRGLKQRKSMFNKIVLAFRSNPALRTIFLALSGPVFALVLGSSILLAFLAPEQYASTARIKVQRTATDITPQSYQRYVVGSYDPYFIQSQFELIQSESVLGRVARKLNLAESWGKRSAGDALREVETIALLRGRVDLRPVRNTDLIEVSVYSKSAREASSIANALAETYRDLGSEQRQSTAGVETPRSRLVEIVDTAVPGLRPVRPNRPLTVFLGLFGGTLLALLVGGVGTLVLLRDRRLSPPAATA
jgi:capsular polysaccharide biosynthesis protein